MKSKVFELADEEATRRLGALLAEQFQNKPALILLSGDLGAGKTTFARGFINALASSHIPVSSPSYSYCNIYETSLPTFHFDLYRIESHEEIRDLGLKEQLYNEDALRLVEWPERLPELAKYAKAQIHLEKNEPLRRALVTYFA